MLQEVVNRRIFVDCVIHRAVRPLFVRADVDEVSIFLIQAQDISHARRVFLVIFVDDLDHKSGHAHANVYGGVMVLRREGS